jgi:hypothetical protein
VLTLLETKWKTWSSLLFILGFISLFVSFVSLFPIPIDSHYFIAKLSELKHADPELQTIYGLARTPVYELLGGVYQNAGAFLLLTIAALTFHFGLLYRICVRTTATPGLALVLTLLATPIFISLVDKSGIQILADFFYRFYPGHFGWNFGGFSTRILAGILYTGLVLCLLTGRDKLIPFLLVASFYSHPNNTVSVVAVYFTFLLLWGLLQERKFPKMQFGLTATAVVLGLAPTILNALNAPSLKHLDLAAMDWYFEMVRNEGDDFSNIYYAINYSKSQMLCLLVPAVLSLIVWIKTDRREIKKLAFFNMVPQIIFLCFLGLELISVKTNVGLLMPLIIPSQIGMKVVQLSYVPTLALFGYMIAGRFPKATLVTTNILLAGLAAFAVAWAIAKPMLGKTMSERIGKLTTAFTNPKPLSYLDFIHLRFKENDPSPATLAMFKLPEEALKILAPYEGKKIDYFEIAALENALNQSAKIAEDKTFTEKFATTASLDQAYHLISGAVPAGSGVIMPPYFNYFRDVFEAYDLFFQIKHDGNFMLGSKVAASALLYRMKVLFGFTYMETAPQTLGYAPSYLRMKYLQLSNQNFDAVKSEYPHYTYLVTEVGHNLNYKILAQDQNFMVYDLGR